MDKSGVFFLGLIVLLWVGYYYFVSAMPKTWIPLSVLYLFFAIILFFVCAGLSFILGVAAFE